MYNYVQFIIHFYATFAKTIFNNVWPTCHIYVYVQHPLDIKWLHVMDTLRSTGANGCFSSEHSLICWHIHVAYQS